MLRDPQYLPVGFYLNQAWSGAHKEKSFGLFYHQAMAATALLVKRLASSQLSPPEGSGEAGHT